MPFGDSVPEDLVDTELKNLLQDVNGSDISDDDFVYGFTTKVTVIASSYYLFYKYIENREIPMIYCQLVSYYIVLLT
jgi:hypothetical protein